MKKKGLFIVFTIVMALVCTVGIGLVTKKDAKACGYFKRTSLKKCVVSLQEQEFYWTGQECKPKVSITNGENVLIEGTDYTVSYKRNIDAGEGMVIVKGMGDYRSKVKSKFRIKGLDFKANCDVILDDANRDVKVYFKGKEVDKSFYSFYFLEDRKVIYDEPNPSGNLYAYIVTRTYTVMGKGPFEGTVIKEYKTIENNLLLLTLTINKKLNSLINEKGCNLENN